MGDFPEPRAPRPPAPPPAPAPSNGAARHAPNAAPKLAPAPHPEKQRPHEQKPKPAPRPVEAEETTLQVEEDAALTRLGHSLAERSAALGRTYAVGMMSAADRARLVQAAQDTPGVTVRAEGEGIHRRVAFIPAKPVPMPKKHQMHDFPDDED